MGPRHQIVLLAPSLLGPVPSTLADGVRDLGPCEGLTHFLSRAKHHPRETPLSGETALLAQLQRFAHPGAENWPTAGAIAASALGFEDQRIHYRAAPVHLRADRDRVLLFAGEGLQMNATDAEEISRDFNQLYAGDEINLSFYRDAWLLSTPHAPGPDLPPLSRVAGRYLDAVMPADEHARRWRQLLNEIQMFLHDHPVNERRTASGALAVNGFWFWAGGRQQPLPLKDNGRLIGDEALMHGVATLGGLPLVPAQALEAVEQAGYTIMLWDHAEQALMSGDAHGWLRALSAFDAQFGASLGEWLASPACDVILDTGANVFTASTAAARWRFWRKNRPLSAWIQQA